MNRQRLVLLTLTIAEAVIFVGACLQLSDPLTPINVAKIRGGMTEDDVTKILGSPTQRREWFENPQRYTVPFPASLPGTKSDFDFEHAMVFRVHSLMTWERSDSTCSVAFGKDGTAVIVNLTDRDTRIRKIRTWFRNNVFK